MEEYVYDLRSKLCEELEQYVAEDERTSLSSALEDTENWLYEDGEDCQKQVYVTKLDELKVSLLHQTRRTEGKCTSPNSTNWR